MSKKPKRLNGGRTLPRVAWDSFERCYATTNRATGAQAAVPPHIKLYGNSLYNVIVREVNSALVAEFEEAFKQYGIDQSFLAPSDPHPPILWLSISRRDRKALIDWRHLQRIKNEIVGPECEAVQLFPAESRLVDESNQFHLFVVNDPTFRWPFGYTNRTVLTPEQVDAEGIGAVQRPFEE